MELIMKHSSNDWKETMLDKIKRVLNINALDILWKRKSRNKNERQAKKKLFDLVLSGRIY